MRLPSPLYVILDREAARGRGLPWLLDEIIAGGCRMVQLRDKASTLAALWPEAWQLRARCREREVAFFVNDRADLALALDADGLHVGQDDLPAPVARRLLRSGMWLGVSTHDQDQARQAVRDGADYVAVGSIFPTATKAAFQLVGPGLLGKLRPEIPVPLVAIGGITEANVETVMGAGADAAAVISAVCSASDPREATRRLLERIAAGVRGREGR